MEKDCSTCGKAVSKMELERDLSGNYVVGLFPNIKSKNSDKIVRQKVERSELEFEDFDYKQGGRYIIMNKSTTGDLKYSPLEEDNWRHCPRHVWQGTLSTNGCTPRQSQLNNRGDK